MRPIALLAISALALALGAIVVGHALVLPALGSSELIDANLARALVEPLRLRVAEVVLVCTLVLALTTRRWLGERSLAAAASVALALAAADRVFLLPRLHRVGGRVDFVAGRPLDQLELTQQLALGHFALLLVLGLVLAALVYALARRTATPAV